MKGVTAVEDSRIVALYWDRNEEAIVQTQRKYERYLLKIAGNFLSDPQDAQESVNDTYLGAWNAIPPHKPNVLSTFLGKITRRISIDRFRKNTSQKRGTEAYVLSLEELDACVAGKEDLENAMEAKMLGAAIGDFLETQSKETQHVFVGKYYYMDSVKEIAAYCRISESKVKILLYRAREGLRTYLEKEGFLP